MIQNPLETISVGGAQLNKEGVLRQLISRFLCDDSGATAIEYGLIAALIAIVVITAVSMIGTNLRGTFNNVANAVQ